MAGEITTGSAARTIGKVALWGGAILAAGMLLSPALTFGQVATASFGGLQSAFSAAAGAVGSAAPAAAAATAGTSAAQQAAIQAALAAGM